MKLSKRAQNKLNIVREIDAEIKKLEEEREVHKEALRELCPEDDTYEDDTGAAVVKLSPTRRFSAAIAQKVIPEQLLPLVTVETIDSAQAKKVLPPALYEQCQSPSGKRQVRLL